MRHASNTFANFENREIAEIGPKGPDGEETLPDINFEWVEPFSRLPRRIAV